MKIILYMGAAIALLRSAAAFLPDSQDKHDPQGQLLFQPAAGPEKAINIPEGSPSNLEVVTAAQRFGSDAPQPHDDTESHNPDRIPSPDDTTLDPLQPQSPNFQIGSPTSQWAITYTPYTDTLSCLPPSTIHADMAAIARKGFTSIRLYSTDCSALHHIGHAAHTYGLKLIIGIPLDDGPSDAATQLSDLTSWANNSTGAWDTIELIVLGNEAIFNEQTTAPALAALLTASRLTLRAAGYTGPLTTTEPLTVLTEHRHTLCPTLDVAAATIHPFFHPATTAATAGAYVRSELARLAALCPGLAAAALETGWPSRGLPNGAAVPGYLEQWVAVAGIARAAGGRSVLLGFGDEGWRDGGAFGVEGSWGCGHVFGE